MAAGGVKNCGLQALARQFRQPGLTKMMTGYLMQTDLTCFKVSQPQHDLFHSVCRRKTQPPGGS